jgi:hypothetical protein
MPETEMHLTEEQMMSLVRNALLVAGHEMGETGDHWPVINSTIHSVMKDWEDLKIERNVHAEMRKHVYEQLDEMDRVLLTCPEDLQADTASKLKGLREIYDAYFEKVHARNLSIEEEDIPAHVKRAQAIIRTLEE